MTPTCPRCGTLLLPNDLGTCPVCRKPVAVAPLEPNAPGVIVHDLQLPPAGVAVRPADPETTAEIRDGWLFHEACAILRGPEPAASRSGLWLLLSLGAFLLVGKQNRSVLELAIVVGVLFFHESGHWLGMQWFGYRNVKMFFLPFFGAAVSGRKEGVPQWQEAIVALLGPIPGLCGCGLYMWHVVSPQPIVAQAATWLVWINAFNLLPLEPLDGGRLLNLVIFSRHHVLESIFLAVTSLVVLALGLFLQMWIFAALGAFGLWLVPARFRIARSASAIRNRWPVLQPRIADAPEPALRDVFEEVKRSSGVQTAPPAPAVAVSMRSVYERALVRPVALLGSLALLAAYCGGLFLFWVWVAALIVEHFRAAPNA